MIEVGTIRVDVARHEVLVHGDLVPLPLKEFELLELLMLNAGRVLTRDVLIDRIWGPNYYGDTKTLDVHVKRLRSKVEDDPANPTRIVTVRGVGYRFERAPELGAAGPSAAVVDAPIDAAALVSATGTIPRRVVTAA